MSAPIDVLKLCSYIDKFKGIRQVVFGDLILDEYVWGTVDRVSPEAPIVVVNVKSESLRLGGAANVANNMSKLGADVTICGVIGEDKIGSTCLDLLASEGIDPLGLVTDAERPTTKKTRVIASSQQIVRVDRESTDAISEEVMTKSLQEFSKVIKHSKGGVISDYGKGVVDNRLSPLLSSLKSSKEIGLNICPIVVDPKGYNYSKYIGATAIKPNKKEATEISGIRIKTRHDACEAANFIKSQGNYDVVMVTLGELGLILLEDNNKTTELDTIAQEVFDVTGAGDTVSAVFTLALSVGASPEEAAILANCAAARVIREIGNATLEPDELKAVVEFWGKEF